MQVTTDHSASSYGKPVIIDYDGRVMEYPAGIRAIRDKMGLSQAAFGARLGVAQRTVQSWEYGHRMPSGAALAFLKEILSY